MNYGLFEKKKEVLFGDWMEKMRKVKKIKKKEDRKMTPFRKIAPFILANAIIILRGLDFSTRWDSKACRTTVYCKFAKFRGISARKRGSSSCEFSKFKVAPGYYSYFKFTSKKKLFTPVKKIHQILTSGVSMWDIPAPKKRILKRLSDPHTCSQRKISKDDTKFWHASILRTHMPLGLKNGWSRIICFESREIHRDCYYWWGPLKENI